MKSDRPEHQAGVGQEPPPSLAQHHLMIAGTGRAGTSFLVRFLAAMGLVTHLAQSGEAQWDEAANAGLEDIPIPGAFDSLPYVVKTPLLSEIVDDVLQNPDIVIDAVIIPIRDLVEVAASRTILELQAIHQQHPWMAGLDRMVENWGVTPGGTMYSLNPVDQGRLLAVGFHHLIERLTKADVPIIFLDFPRLAEDPSYLFTKLQSVLPAGATLPQAEASHSRIADAAKIRTGRELLSMKPGNSTITARQGPGYLDLNSLETIAIRRELRQLRAEIPASNDQFHGRERQLGQREHAIGQREIIVAQREQAVSERADELARQMETLTKRAQELDQQKGLADRPIAQMPSAKHENYRLNWLGRLLLRSDG